MKKLFILFVGIVCSIQSCFGLLIVNNMPDSTIHVAYCEQGETHEMAFTIVPKNFHAIPDDLEYFVINTLDGQYRGASKRYDAHVRSPLNRQSFYDAETESIVISPDFFIVKDSQPESPCYKKTRR